MRIDELETPCVLVDLERVRANLDRWQAFCDAAGLANRPHMKTHKTLELARLQADAGAAGICVQKLGEAEIYVDAGFDDVFIAYNLLGDRKLERLAALAERANVSVSADDARLLPGLASAAGANGLTVLVECETGLGRAGVGSPEEAAELAGAIAATDGLTFGGFYTYPTGDRSREFVERATELAERKGLAAERRSFGGTPGMWDAPELRPVATEYRVGNYAYYDRRSLAAGACEPEHVALTVLTTVASRQGSDRAVLDAGSKALAADTFDAGGHGLILEAPEAEIWTLSEEHGHVRTNGARLELGDRVRVVPNHSCVVSNLFDEVNVVAGDTVVARWAVVARGRVV